MSGSTSTTTTVVFSPVANSAFTFNAILDGSMYTVTVTWNLWAQRWYFTITAPNAATPVVTKALIACNPGYLVNLLFGYFFETVMYFDDASQTFTIIYTPAG